MRKHSKRYKAKTSKAFKSEREWLGKFNYVPKRLRLRNVVVRKRGAICPIFQVKETCFTFIMEI